MNTQENRPAAEQFQSRRINGRRFLTTMSSVAGLTITPTARLALAHQADERLRLTVVGMVGYADNRRMFSEMSGQIDALVVSDCDYFHGVVCGAALRASNPMCGERPLGVTINNT